MEVSQCKKRPTMEVSQKRPTVEVTPTYYSVLKHVEGDFSRPGCVSVRVRERERKRTCLHDDFGHGCVFGNESEGRLVELAVLVCHVLRAFLPAHAAFILILPHAGYRPPPPPDTRTHTHTNQ